MTKEQSQKLIDERDEFIRNAVFSLQRLVMDDGYYLISKETLQLIVDRYTSMYHPPSKPVVL